MPRINVIYDGVVIKEGAKNGKAWKKWSIKYDGTWYSTFKSDLGDLLTDWQGEQVGLEYKIDGDFCTILDVFKSDNSLVKETAQKAKEALGVQNSSQSSPQAPRGTQLPSDISYYIKAIEAVTVKKMDLDESIFKMTVQQLAELMGESLAILYNSISSNLNKDNAKVTEGLDDIDLGDKDIPF